MCPANEDAAQHNPDQCRNPAKEHARHDRAYDWSRRGNGGKMLRQEHGFRGRDEIIAIVDCAGGSHSPVVNFNCARQVSAIKKIPRAKNDNGGQHNSRNHWTCLSPARIQVEKWTVYDKETAYTCRLSMFYRTARANASRPAPGRSGLPGTFKILPESTQSCGIETVENGNSRLRARARARTDLGRL